MGSTGRFDDDSCTGAKVRSVYATVPSARSKSRLGYSGTYPRRGCLGWTWQWVTVPLKRPFQPERGTVYTAAVGYLTYYVKTEDYGWPRNGNGVMGRGSVFTVSPSCVPDNEDTGGANYWVEGRRQPASPT